METGEAITPIGSALSCNWTESLEDCLERDMVNGEVTLSDAFRNHVEQIESWSVSPTLIERFPDLESRTRVESEPAIKLRPH